MTKPTVKLKFNTSDVVQLRADAKGGSVQFPAGANTTVYVVETYWDDDGWAQKVTPVTVPDYATVTVMAVKP